MTTEIPRPEHPEDIVDAEVVESPPGVNPMHKRLLRELSAAWREGWAARANDPFASLDDDPYAAMLAEDYHHEAGEPPC